MLLSAEARRTWQHCFAKFIVFRIYIGDPCSEATRAKVNNVMAYFKACRNRLASGEQVLTEGLSVIAFNQLSMWLSSLTLYPQKAGIAMAKRSRNG